jgi:hypothetical protein
MCQRDSGTHERGPAKGCDEIPCRYLRQLSGVDQFLAGPGQIRHIQVQQVADAGIGPVAEALAVADRDQKQIQRQGRVQGVLNPRHTAMLGEMAA